MAVQHASSTIEVDAPRVPAVVPAPGSTVPAPAHAPRPAGRAPWSRLAAGIAVIIGLALLLLRTDPAGQVWGAVLAAAGLVATVAVEWVRVARRRALQHRAG